MAPAGQVSQILERGHLTQFPNVAKRMGAIRGNREFQGVSHRDVTVAQRSQSFICTDVHYMIELGGPRNIVAVTTRGDP